MLCNSWPIPIVLFSSEIRALFARAQRGTCVRFDECPNIGRGAYASAMSNDR